MSAATGGHSPSLLELRLRPLDARRRLRLLLASFEASRHAGTSARAVGRALRAVAVDRFEGADVGLFNAIEATRRELSISDEPVVIDLSEHVTNLRIETTVGEWGASAAIDPARGRLLFALVRELKATRCIELGTNMGISAAYIASALHRNGAGRVISVDMVAKASERAAAHHESLGLNRAAFKTGLFADLLPSAIEDLEGCDFAFIDGDHHEESTLAYFEDLAAAIGADGVVALDNIAGTQEMERAWERIRRHPLGSLAIKFEALGVVVLR